METTLDNSIFNPGTIISQRYEVLDPLGAGGVGIVVRVRDRVLDNEIIALKLLFPQMARDRTQFARFRNEVLLARKLGHPNIVRLYDIGSAGKGYYFISMEYVEGGSLSKRIYGDRHTRLNFQESLEIIYQICQGLSCAHSQGVVHRDLKPDNILLTNIGHVKISDFGLARSMTVDKGFTDTGETVGTPYYMAPEQIRGDRPDARVDIYSLGIMAFEMVMGVRPFVSENYVELAHKHFREPIPIISTKESAIPKWFERFVQKCCEKSPDNRFQSAQEAADTLIANMNDEENMTASRLPAVMSFVNRREIKPHLKSKKVRVGVVCETLVVLLLVMGVSVGGLYWYAKRKNSQQQLLPAAQRDKAGWSSSLLTPDIEQLDLYGAVYDYAKRLNAALESSNTSSVQKEAAVAALLRELDSWLSDNKDSIDFNKVGGPSSKTALLWAVQEGSLPVIELLLSHGADPKVANSEGRTPLIEAVLLGRQDIVERLLRGARESSFMRAGDTNGLTALHHAAVNNQREVAQLLVVADPQAAIAKDREGKTPLILAAEKGDSEMVGLLVNEMSQAVNETDYKGNTALIYAAKAGNQEIVKTLLNRNATIDVKNMAGRSARDEASRSVRNLINDHQENNQPK